MAPAVNDPMSASTDRLHRSGEQPPLLEKVCKDSLPERSVGYLGKVVRKRKNRHMNKIKKNTTLLWSAVK